VGASGSNRAYIRACLYSSSRPLREKITLAAILPSDCFFAPHQRYRADNYAKLRVAFSLSLSYPLMPKSPAPTASSFGNLGSAVKRAPVVRRYETCKTAI
jgi:hypothetical protein